MEPIGRHVHNAGGGGAVCALAKAVNSNQITKPQIMTRFELYQVQYILAWRVALRICSSWARTSSISSALSSSRVETGAGGARPREGI
jgi:hypothetical protein